MDIMHRKPAANDEKLSVQRILTSWLSTQVILEKYGRDHLFSAQYHVHHFPMNKKPFSSSGTERAPLVCNKGCFSAASESGE